MAPDLPFASTFGNIPTPGQLDGHFASLEEIRVDANSPRQDTDLAAIIRYALADAHTFAEQLRNKPRNKYEAFRARLMSNRTKRTCGISHNEIQWHLKRDLDTLRELQANILRDSHTRWTCLNHDAEQKGYILCFGTAVNDEDEKGIVVQKDETAGGKAGDDSLTLETSRMRSSQE
ncbi:hypothetical protein LTR70_005438 [Exophiala xenobiotica]|uniref:Uncharacterized protein n=1 Tax=Lithohypha guttulata TaxID=1690604 RepID=A0ABR0KA65_9EURO|nr:hypothetical protein LTR24_005180 [Lithohypha guttulata]KAK5318416.1 hypothetical protein LTR70_005438 [Exophiala xenobiotica]